MLQDLWDEVKQLGNRILVLLQSGWIGFAYVYKIYTTFVDNLGSPWSGIIHSTVFMGIGSFIAHLLLGT